MFLWCCILQSNNDRRFAVNWWFNPSIFFFEVERTMNHRFKWQNNIQQQQSNTYTLAPNVLITNFFSSSESEKITTLKNNENTNKSTLSSKITTKEHKESRLCVVPIWVKNDWWKFVWFRPKRVTESTEEITSGWKTSKKKKNTKNEMR